MNRHLSEIEKLFKASLEDDEEMPDGKVWEAIDRVLDKDDIVKIEKKYKNLKKLSFLLLFMLLAVGFYEIKSRSASKDKEALAKELVLEKKIAASTKAINGQTVNSLNANDSASANAIAVDGFSSNKNSAGIDQNHQASEIAKGDNSSQNGNEESYFNPLHEKGRSTSNQVSFTADANSATAKNNLFTNNIAEKQISEAGNVYYADNLAPVTLRAINTTENVPSVFIPKSSLLVDNNHSVANPSITKKIKASPFSINFYFSPELASYRLKDNTPTNNVDDVLKIETKEHHKSSMSLGASITYRLSKNVGIESGLQYINTNIVLAPSTIYAAPDETGDVKYLVNVSSGNGYVLPTFRTNPNIGDSLYSFAATHTLKYVSVPINLRYYFNFGRFSLNVMSGIASNILINGTIKTYVENASERELETVNTLEGLKKIYFTGAVGFGIDYKLNKKATIMLHPTYRFALNSINKSASVNSYPTSFGLRAGVSFDF